VVPPLEECHGWRPGPKSRLGYLSVDLTGKVVPEYIGCLLRGCCGRWQGLCIRQFSPSQVGDGPSREGCGDRPKSHCAGQGVAGHLGPIPAGLGLKRFLIVVMLNLAAAPVGCCRAARSALRSERDVRTACFDSSSQRMGPLYVPSHILLRGRALRHQE